MPGQLPADERIEQAIADRGCFITGVFRDPERGIPEFAYTIGLTERFNHPELLMMGLRVGEMYPILQAVVARIAAGDRFGDWDRSDKPIPDLSLGFRSVPASEMNEWARAAASRYGDDGYGLLQVMYPDRNGRMPWDPDVEEPYGKLQGALLDAMTKARS